jgi:hypothetical protein
MIKEHDRVVLTAAVPEQGLVPGDVGTVVHIYGENKAFEIEFLSLDGETAAIATVEASKVRSVHKREITHSRQFAVA